jgi:hypothetical protein
MQFAGRVMTMVLHTTCLVKHVANVVKIFCVNNNNIRALYFQRRSEESPIIDNVVWAQISQGSELRKLPLLCALLPESRVETGDK